ncbi:hypothetical protein [Microbulbifer sp. THAF38]|uniref:hypothetical protein n=1 Tax=Microbulbifer sp. THAF38 TaxID=2587856 RepID=UPI001267C320|nr:hypothetical protein [Microbulbifer sp. THAF38]QFT55576.1 hypothetical protein FIU95_13560 [Microbulbifer sp. THAF38]
MALFPIRQLGERGVNCDSPAYELQINEFSRAQNVRFSNGAVLTMPAPYALETLSEPPVWGAGWIAGEAPQLAYASATRLYFRENETFVDRTGADYADGYSSSNWHATTWGESIIFNNGQDIPQIKGPNDIEFKDLPNWPSDLRADCVRPYKNFLIALGVTEGGVEYPNTVRWSDEAEPGGVPETWDVADTTNLAGANPIDSGASRLVDCLPMGSANIVYSKDATYLMQLVGGQFTFSFETIFDQGILCRDAVAAFDRNHFVVGATEIFVHDGLSMKPMAHRRVNRTFYGELAQRDKVRCVTNHKTKEIWTVYSTNADGPANRALIYNWLDNTFTFIDLPNVRCAFFAAKAGEVITFGDLDAQGIAFSDLNLTYGELTDTNYYPVMYYLTDTHLMQTDFLATGDNTQLVYLERTGIDLDQVMPQGVGRLKSLKRIIPQFDGQGQVKISVGGAKTATGPVRWKTPKVFDVAKGLDLHFRIKARYLAIKVESVSGGFWRLTGWDLDLNPVDGR